MHKYKAANVTTQPALTAASGIGTGRGLGFAPKVSGPLSFITCRPADPARTLPCALLASNPRHVHPPLPAALAMAADLVTPLSTAAVRLAYQLHCVIDCQSNSHPTFYSFIFPQGFLIIFLVTATLHRHQRSPPHPTTPHQLPRGTVLSYSD